MVLFLHQTTTNTRHDGNKTRCLWSYSYIKPQRYRGRNARAHVVYGPIPTSNHNRIRITATAGIVVYGPIPTSNHNRVNHKSLDTPLFMVLFLHQTTTVRLRPVSPKSCLWSYSYIKPQLPQSRASRAEGCLWSYSYIKPQLPRGLF